MLTITNHQAYTNQNHSEMSHIFKMAIIKKTKINAGQDIEKKEYLYTVNGNVNQYSHYEQQYEN